MADLYKSEKWLRLQYVTKGKKPEDIAKECNVTKMTIYLYLNKYGLMK